MSGTPHPTIEGCTVTIQEHRGGQGWDGIFFPSWKVRHLAFQEVVVYATTQTGRIDVSQFLPEHAETVIAMIRDQQQWLEGQGESKQEGES